MAREAIKYFSEQWYRYPYSHATTVEGPIEGMEYPMLTFVPNSPTREDQQWALSHEFGHEWFPMIVGSNERLYPWMDEGFNTFIDLAGAAKYFAGTSYGDSIEVHPLHLYSDHARPGDEQPLIEKPVEVRDLFWGGYQKPALMMQLLRYEVLGKERFDRLLKEGGPNPEANIDRLFHLALSRPTTAKERTIMLGYLNATQMKVQQAKAMAPAEAYRQALAQLGKVVMNLNEFVYVD